MAFKFYERPDSRKSSENPRSITFGYTAEGSTSNLYVKAYAIAATPVIYDGLWRQDIQITPDGHMLWRVDVPYGPRQPVESGNYKWSYDTTGGTAKITHALEHIQSYAPAGKTAPDHKGAIGVNQNGDVEGCEKVVPAPKWTETWDMPAAAASFAYTDILAALTGMVNASTFRGKTPGTVRFDGAQGSGSNKNPDVVEVTFHFTQGIDVTGLSYGEISGVAKGAWQYLWVEYAQEEDSAANKNASRPIAVHVGRIYDPADFGLLQIGG